MLVPAFLCNESIFQCPACVRSTSWYWSWQLDTPLHAGVYGRVTELANATSKRYNIALAVLLAKDMDSVVVKDEAVAKDCIKLLKDRKAPPMTFYPLNSVRVRRPGAASRGHSRRTRHTMILELQM